MTDYTDFVDYVFGFYGTSGIYDMGATRDQILAATEIHAATGSYEGDSVDREAVRDIMIDKFSLVFPN